MECETVRIVSPVSDDNPLGYIVINKSDLTEAHEIFVDPEVAPAKRKYTKSSDAQ